LTRLRWPPIPGGGVSPVDSDPKGSSAPADVPVGVNRQSTSPRPSRTHPEPAARGIRLRICVQDPSSGPERQGAKA
jgi:hypothetical protein